MPRLSVEEVLGRLERPVTPRAGFAEALFDALAKEFESKRQVPQEGRRAELPPTRRPWTRIAPLAAAAAIVLVVSIVWTFLPRPRSALAVVQEAIRATQSLPPFSATVSYSFTEGSEVPGTGTYLVSYKNRSEWRIDVDERTGNPAGAGNFAEESTCGFPTYFSAPGDYVLSDGERVGLFLAARNYFFSRPLDELCGSPLAQLTWEEPFAGSQTEVFNTPVEAVEGPYPLTAWRSRCADSETFPDEQIAGRLAHHVRCGEWELWIDATTGLVLKVVTSAYVVEFRQIEYSVVFAPGVFAVKVPESACDRGTGSSPDDPQTCLTTGEVAPMWAGPLLAGEAVDLSLARGRPVLVLFWSDFFQPQDLPRQALGDFQVAFEQWRGRATLISVDTGPGVTEQTARDVVGREGYTFPVVLDGFDPFDPQAVARIATLWGVEGVPAWVALDAEGRVVDVKFGRLTTEQIDEMLSRAGE